MRTVIEDLVAALPPTFARSEVPKLTGGMIASGTLANLDSKDGKEKAGNLRGLFYFRRRACYRRDAFLTWFASHLSAGVEKS